MTAFTPPLLGSGATATALALRRMRNALSVLHIVAHPDDEDAHALTTLARAEGFRVGIFSLTRGESGENAIDHRAHEALGALRTEELLRAATWYGAEDVYFGRFYDYGFSKRIDEAFARWGQDTLVCELVRAIRTFRPDVVLSRFRGDPRDGHAHHQAAGWAAREAFRVAPFAHRYADLALPPHKPSALYALDEPDPARRSSSLWEAIDSAATLAPLGVHCGQIAELGYAEHRSQTAGRQVLPRPQRSLYRCLARHNPHLGEARFGFRTQALLGFSDPAAERHYTQALAVIEEGLANGQTTEALASPMRDVLTLAPTPLQKSRADDLWQCIQGRAPHVRASSHATREPNKFYEPFPTWNVEKPRLELEGEGPEAKVDTLTVLCSDEPILNRGPHDAVYASKLTTSDLLLPFAPPSCVIEEQDSQTRTFWRGAVVARDAQSPHDFQIVRARPVLPPGVDLRYAGEPPASVRRTITRRVWYIPGRSECYGDALRQLGAELVESTFVDDALGATDTLLVGFRAYERYGDLRRQQTAVNDALVRGARVVVMGQTAGSFAPGRDAPFAGQLTHGAPEACEEDRPVTLLEADDALFRQPHPIEMQDFEGWHEQIGSKFWSSWDARYRPLLACADLDEPEQRGVLLRAAVGSGCYTYCGLALHLQLARGHAGAYKLFANLVQG